MGRFSLFKLVKKEYSYESMMLDNNVENMFDNYPDTVLHLDTFGRVIYVNNSVKRIFGFEPKELLLDKMRNCVEPDQKERSKYFELSLNGKTISYHAKVTHKNGQIMDVEINQIPITNGTEVTSVLLIIKDITHFVSLKEEANLIQDKLEFARSHDVLTKLPNRQAFERKMGELIQQKRPLSCLLLNFDRLKLINESLGQRVGDQLIKEVGQKVQSVLGEDSYLARTSGDEFGILIWNYLDPSHTEIVANRVIESCLRPIFIDQYELFVTASIGISHYGTDALTKDALLQSATIALSNAQESGKNNYIFYTSARERLSANEIVLERELRNAIKNEELVLHFQPRVSPSSGKIVSAEALVRWNHPKRGQLSPGEFIPLAEKIGFVHEIGDWVLNEVCICLQKWKENELRIVPISINIAANRFFQKDWKAKITEAMEKNSIDPELIEFEITETTLIQYEEAVEEALLFLKSRGFRIALDDFGTGYSSLTYVKKFPIDTIKIDRSFINQATESEGAAVIIKSLIYMAKGLNMNLVAEGVETYEQLSFLKQQECQEIQGYIYSRPVTEEKFQGVLKRKYLKPVPSSRDFDIKNRRNYFRVSLPFPMRSKMSITSIGGKKIDVGNSEVLIEDIGPGGLRFLSTLNLPVRPDIVCNFEIVILGKLTSLNGNVTWKEDVKGIHRYGISFNIDEKNRDQLTGFLNQLALQIRKNPFVPECDFVDDNRFTYLKKLAISEQMKGFSR